MWVCFEALGGRFQCAVWCVKVSTDGMTAARSKGVLTAKGGNRTKREAKEAGWSHEPVPGQQQGAHALAFSR
jgi:hypothetical protein